MPITTEPDLPGEPSLWSASVDALGRRGRRRPPLHTGSRCSVRPTPAATRLFVISAGNVDPSDFQADYRAACDNASIQDPAQAWNALTVGAYTELDRDSQRSQLRRLGCRLADRWRYLAAQPHVARSSAIATMADQARRLHGGRQRPRTTAAAISTRPTRLLSPAHDGYRRRPRAWVPQTRQAPQPLRPRGSLPSRRRPIPTTGPRRSAGCSSHAAEWTPTMLTRTRRRQLRRTDKLMLLRRYGWGVPAEQDVLTSARNAVTLVTQDEFVPFQGPDFGMRILSTAPAAVA